MGCQSSNNQTGNCVTSIVQQIIKAQRKAAEEETVTCLTSCEQSINDLLSPDRDDRRRPRHTTIPFMLTCKSTCKQFVGKGVIQKRAGGQQFFKCLKSSIFKVRGFVRGSNHCVRLELLLPISDGSSSKDGSDSGSSCCQICSVNSNGYVKGFRKTGVCITVDLNCFCGITCLDPITPRNA